MNYAWQKALDGQSSLAEVKVQNPFDRRQDYSRSSWDINHVFSFAYVYELPFGKGRKFGANWAKAADLLLGGWALEGITRLETGTAAIDFDRCRSSQHGPFDAASQPGRRSQRRSKDTG